MFKVFLLDSLLSWMRLDGHCKYLGFQRFYQVYHHLSGEAKCIIGNHIIGLEIIERQWF